jgi:UPF0716 protein FxsA
MSRIFFGFLLLLAIEISLWVWIAHLISGWWIFLSTVAAFFIGMSLMIKSFRALPQIQAMQGMKAFQFNAGAPELGITVTRTLAGLLLVMPGLLTDAFALLLFLPPVQYSIQKLMLRYVEKRQHMMSAHMQQYGFSQDGFSQDSFSADDFFRSDSFKSDTFRADHFSGTTVEGEARVVEPKPDNQKQLQQPINDD